MRSMPSLTLALFLLAGCDGGSEPSTADDTTGAEDRTPTENTARAASDYTVHEWGLMRAGAGDTLLVGALGPAVDRPMMVIEKPVLYFHLADDTPRTVARVRVEAQGGQIVEHWPLRPGSVPAVVEWTSLTLDPRACSVHPPGYGEPPCSTMPPGEACESSDLLRAATTDGACVRGEGFESSLLFYRSTSSTFTVPLVAERTSHDTLRVHNRGDHPIPGRLIRFRREGEVVEVAVANPPPPHGEVTIDAVFVGSEAARTAVNASLLELGLTEPEARAFLASWDSTFFGTGAQERPVEELVETPPSEQSPPPTDSLLYFLPEADTDRVATLSFDPPPREVRRAMAVYTAL